MILFRRPGPPSMIPSASVEALLKTPYGVCAISHSLDVQKIIASVQDESAGATAVFIGTTRNSFQGKTVTRLEYQAYSKLAIKTMARIICDVSQPAAQSDHELRAQEGYVSSIIRCVVYHRIGVVPVGEPSIVIAVSSPHRKEAFAACERILEEIKSRAQIWKRECYEGEDENQAEWKSNK